MNAPSITCLLIGFIIHGQFFYGYKRLSNKKYFTTSLTISFILMIVSILISDFPSLENVNLNASNFLRLPLSSLGVYYILHFMYKNIYNKEPRQMSWGGTYKGHNLGDYFYTVGTLLLPIIPVII